jgi:CTP synthase
MTAKDNHHTKYIFISGGVISSVGKGITTAAIATLLEARGYKVAPLKCDPYLNVDAGTIRPQEHGEVFVTEDGMETDQDVGNYERFMNTDLSSANYLTNGQVYQEIIRRERNFEYEGEDVEIVPHVPEEIIRRIELAGKKRKADVVIVEIGGTVGEYQNILFIEANRIMKYRYNRDVIHLHVAYLPTPPSIGEMKSKPVQTSVKLLNGSGIQPDFIIGRGEKALDKRRKSTLAMICSVPEDRILSMPNMDTIYRVPLELEKQGLTEKILDLLDLKEKKPNLKSWQNLVSQINRSKKEVNIAVVGKYFETGDDYKISDAYISVVESLKHAGWSHGVKSNLHWIASREVEEKGAADILKDYDGIVVPGGFGSRGTEGLIETIQYARERNIPYLGLCYGMQMATIEFARNVLKLKNAHTVEVDDDTPHPVINIMPDQEKKLLKKEYGATMRLGAWDCALKSGSKAEEAYKSRKISERHRHRYEFNNKYRKQFEAAGMIFSGTSPDGHLVEIIELANHPFFVATQFHPEFKSSQIQKNIRALKKRPLGILRRAVLFHREVKLGVDSPSDSDAFAVRLQSHTALL